jgi:dipeptidase
MSKIYALLAVFVLVALFVFPSYELQTITNDNCTTIIIGKNASATGFILVAHNEDDSGSIELSLEIEERNSFPGSVNLTEGTRVYREARTMLTLPLPEKSYAYAWSHMEEQDFSDSYINEKGVVIFSDACPSKEDKPDLAYGGIRYYLRRWVAEQAGSAREGVSLMGSLIESYGYGDSGRTYIIADPSEAWVLHAVYGKHWVAQRVPDDSVVVISNCYVINGIDLRDSKNFLGSKDIMSYAKERGWWSGEEGFDFAKSYGKPEAQTSESNIYRRWLAVYLTTGRDFDPTALPFAVRPKEKVTLEKLMSTMRSHFEGTKYGAQPKEALEAQGSFHRSFSYRPICVTTTQESSIVELRSNMPEALSVVWWRASCNPCLNVYVPWYPLAMITSNSQSPEVYRDGEAFWTFRTLSDLVDMDYKNAAGTIKNSWTSLEKDLLESQKPLEDLCSELINEGKRSEAALILSHYSSGSAIAALDIADNAMVLLLEP